MSIKILDNMIGIKMTNALGAETRIRSIDILRGAIMVLMAIDHVRVYSGIPAGGTSSGIFFTRWVTHFSAPGFAFFAGVSAFLYGLKVSKKALSSFLFTRGLLLVIFELTLVRFFWTFNFNYGQFLLAGVIWMLGWCMIIMALLVRLNAKTIGIIGIIIVASQQVFQHAPELLPQAWQIYFSKIWNFVYPTANAGPAGMTILYVIVPWIGVMAVGYGFGTILKTAPEKRKRTCLQMGISCIILYLIIGTILILKNPSASQLPFLFKLLNQEKYPASQLFLLMTLGPLITLVPFAERSKGWLANVLTIFGRVPFFYYLLHILIIHLSALIVNYVRSGVSHQDWYATAPYVAIAEIDRWPLGLLYLVYIIDLVILYFVCRWYSAYKSAHPEKKWLRYM